MQIVIDIPDDLYYEIQAYKTIFDEHNSELATVINDGKLLPKGHERLIDADAFITTMEDVSKRQKYNELLIDDSLTVDDVFKAIIESLQNKGLAEGDSTTIIEADVPKRRKCTPLEENDSGYNCENWIP